jgi:predicted DNA-binding protein
MTQWSDADYRAHGYVRLSLRLPVEVRDRIRALAKSRGISIARLLEEASAPKKEKP